MVANFKEGSLAKTFIYKYYCRNLPTKLNVAVAKFLVQSFNKQL